MYCSRCEAYIPLGLDLKRCPSCDVDLEVEALPVEKKKEPLDELPPPPPPPPRRKPREKIAPESRFNVFQALGYSFFSSDFYVDVARRWKGACLVFLTVLSGVSGLALTASFVIQYGEVQNQSIIPIAGHVPAIGFKDGVMTMVERSPNILKDTEQKMNLAVFDTTGKTTSVFQIPAVFLFTRDHLVMHDQAQGEKSVEYPKDLDLKLNNEILYYFIEQFERWLPFLVFPFMCLAANIGFLISALLFSLAGMLFALFMKVRLEYSQIFRLSAVSLTPATIISSAFTFLLQDIDERTTFFYVIPLGYLIFSLVALRRQAAADEREKLALEAAQKSRKHVLFK